MNSILNIYNKDENKLVFVKDMLFATLETSTRNIKLPNNLEFLITDTVGFVSKLPHHLVESFKSTLEEIKEANLIIHVIDASSPYLDLQVNTTNQVLSELGIKDIPIVYAVNKIDKLPSDIYIPNNYSPSINTSSKTMEGYSELIKYIENALFSDYETNTYMLPFNQGNIYNTMKEKGEVYETSYLPEGIKVRVRLSVHLTNLYSKYKVK